MTGNAITIMRVSDAYPIFFLLAAHIVLAAYEAFLAFHLMRHIALRCVGKYAVGDCEPEAAWQRLLQTERHARQKHDALGGLFFAAAFLYTFDEPIKLIFNSTNIQAIESA